MLETCYLVGGAVRDLLLGRPPRECDYAFSGGVERFVQANPKARKVGRSVRVFLLDGQEFSPLRGDVAEDLASRDLTVNALALEASGRLHAHPLALADLRGRVLRAASDHAFADDPARIFRLARFAAVFPGWSLDPDTLVRAREAAAARDAASLPAERVCRELIKAMHAPEPGRFLAALQACGALSPWFAELEGADNVPAGPLAYHQDSVLGHTMEVMNRLAGDPLAAWMALCHDLGKTRTPADVLPHHYGHERRGAAAAEALSRRLGMPRRWRQAGILAADLHMLGGRYAELRPGTRCDLLCAVHAARLHEAFWHVAEADSGLRLKARADEDLRRILAVRLPEKWQGRGEESGVRLRELRCRELARKR
jgi:tRNA nucleotidyltransferase (CCA-adding enzyme)